MKRVTGLGGIFFKATDNKKTFEWYKTHLGIDSNQCGRQFKWQDIETGEISLTAWSIFKKDTK